MRKNAIFLFCPPVLLWAGSGMEEANRLFKAHKHLAALECLDRILKANPQDPEALILAGELQLRLGNPSRAQAHADSALNLRPRSAAAHLLRGNSVGAQIAQAGVLRRMAMASEVRIHYEQAVLLDPRSRDARQALFAYYLRAPSIAGGGLEKAKAFAEQTLGIDAALGETFTGKLLQQKKDLGGAQAAFRRAIAADPGFGQPLNEIGYVELAMNQVDFAIAHFRQFVAVAPEDPNSHDSLGDGFLAKGAVDDAIAAYRAALALDPEFAAALLHLGEALQKKGRREEAVTAYRKCAGSPKDSTYRKQALAHLRSLGDLPRS